MNLGRINWSLGVIYNNNSLYTYLDWHKNETQYEQENIKRFRRRRVASILFALTYICIVFLKYGFIASSAFGVLDLSALKDDSLISTNWKIIWYINKWFNWYYWRSLCANCHTYLTYRFGKFSYKCCGQDRGSLSRTDQF